MTPPRILIVEDEGIVAEDLKSTLISFGYNVAGIATHGETAVERARDIRPDLILMDIYLAGTMNGIEAAEQIRRILDIPVIYLTAYSDEQLLDTAKLTHPYGYILKPYAERELRACIEIALYTHDLNRKLKGSEERFRTLLSSLQLGIFVIDSQTHTILDVNPKGLEMIGGSKDSVLGSLCHGFICPAEPGRCPVTDLGQTLDDSDTLLITATGKEILVQKSVISTILGGKEVLIESFIDLPDRKRAGQALEESERKCQNLIQMNTDAMLILDKEHSFVFANFAAEQLFGRSHEELLKMPFEYDILPGELREIEILRRDETIAFGEIRSSVISWENNPSRMIIIRDITERKRAEDALRETEERLLDFFENAGDLIQSVNPDGSFIYVNRTWRKTLGYTIGEVQKLTIFDIIHPDSQAHCMEIFKRVLSGETVDGIEAKFVSKDGTVIEVEGNANCRFVDGKPASTRSIFRNITERRQMEDAIQLANKKLKMLSSITRHDILNKVTGLRMYLELSKEHVTDPLLLGFINKEDEGIQAIAKQIEFARIYEEIGVNAPEWQDIFGLIRSAESQLQGLEEIEVRVDIPPLQVYADALIEKVFFNLMENSLRHGEHVTRVGFSFEKTAGGALITYMDDGAGISAEDKPRLFQKGFGKNTGLGLFLSREILAITAITIHETGEPGKGARFEITVPEGGFRYVLQDAPEMLHSR